MLKTVETVRMNTEEKMTTYDTPYYAELALTIALQKASYPSGKLHDESQKLTEQLLSWLDTQINTRHYLDIEASTIDKCIVIHCTQTSEETYINYTLTMIPSLIAGILIDIGGHVDAKQEARLHQTYDHVMRQVITVQQDAAYNRTYSIL